MENCSLFRGSPTGKHCARYPVSCKSHHLDKPERVDGRHIRKTRNSSQVCETLTPTQLYSSALGLLSLVSLKRGPQATRINVFLLFVTLAVFIYRDVWPLATYDQVPVDAAVEGPLFWVKFAILTVIAVVVPLFIPRQYVPVDPEVRT